MQASFDAGKLVYRKAREIKEIFAWLSSLLNQTSLCTCVKMIKMSGLMP